MTSKTPASVNAAFGKISGKTGAQAGKSAPESPDKSLDGLMASP